MYTYMYRERERCVVCLAVLQPASASFRCLALALAHTDLNNRGGSRAPWHMRLPRFLLRYGQFAYLESLNFEFASNRFLHKGGGFS